MEMESEQTTSVAAFPKLVEMWRNGRGCDVTVVCKDNEALKAHSLVLCSVSDKLDELLLNSVDKLISSPDVHVSTWQTLLEVIYTGNFTQAVHDDYPSLELAVSLAESLGMNSIVEKYNCTLAAITSEATEISLQQATPVMIHYDNITHNLTEPDIGGVVQETHVNMNDSGQPITVNIINDSINVKNESQNMHLESKSGLDYLNKGIPNAGKRCSRKRICFGCFRKNCKAEKVKCVLCNCVVNNDLTHINNQHPFTPQTSNWVFTCKNISIDGPQKSWLICKKKQKNIKDDMGQEMILVEFECCLCRSSFSSLNKVVNHVKEEHKISVRLCKICGSGFETSLQCRDHEHFCNGGDILCCEECGLRVGSLHSLLAHTHCHRTDQVRSREHKITEENCDKVQTTRQSKCIRCGDNCNARRVRCWYCYNTVDNDIKHMEEVHPFTPNDSLWVYTCKNLPAEDSQDLNVICAKEFNDEGNLCYKCFKCSNQFQCSDEMDAHLRKEHNIRAKVCDQCEMGLMKDYHGQDHAYFCKGGQLLLCKICNNFMNSARGMKDHIYKIHNTEMKDNYSEVTLSNPDSVITSFINKTNQRKVNESWQPNVKSYCCKVCNESFSSRQQLKLHVCSKRRDSFDGAPRRSRRQVAVNSKYKDYITDFPTSKPKTDDDENIEAESNEEVQTDPLEEYTNNIETVQIANLNSDFTSEFVGCDMLKQDPNAALNNPFKEQGKVKKLKRKSSLNTDNGVCSNCNGVCTADKVQCFYCFEVVDNDISHRETCHMYGDSIWLFSCKLDDEAYANVKKSILFQRIDHHKKDDGERDPKKANLYQFKCLKCNGEFQTVDELQKHVVKRYHCPLCDLYITKRTTMKKHYLQVHEVKAITCAVCVTGFRDQAMWQEHEQFCTGAGVLVCEHCDKEFCSLLKYKAHRKDVHNVEDDSDLKESTESKMKKVKLEQQKELVPNKEELAILKQDTPELDDEEKDPDYNEEHQSASDEEDDDDDVEEDEYKPAPYLLNRPKKKGRGRPRKYPRPNQVSTKSAPLNEAELSVLYQDKFKELAHDEEATHAKMCYHCGSNCSSESVKCGYCNFLVFVADKVNHMHDMHPLIPPTSAWPVNCRYFKLSVQIPEVVCKQFVEYFPETATYFVDENKGLVCTVCNELCGSAKKTEEHLQNVHNVKAVFCKQCGVGIKTSFTRLIADHQHFCHGGKLLACIDCDKYVGSWKSAENHRKIHHAVTEPKKRKLKKPLYKSFMTETQGNYGYTIVCADCNGTCKNAPVKCSLCQELVKKDDIHMKLKHPYTPSNTWVVFCRYAVHTGTLSNNTLVPYLGEKVPTVSQNDLLEEGSIPSNHNFHFKCNHCQTYFLQRKFLKQHIKREHIEPLNRENNVAGGMFTFSCKSCEALLYGRSYFFQDHSQFCATGQLFKCEICSKQFCGLQKLNQHLKAKHNKVYSQKQKLRKKALRVSNCVVEIPDGTILNCAECTFTTPLIKSMKDHNRIVHGWRGLQLTQFCRFCFQVFKIRSDRERHEQNDHLGGQRVYCETCGENFDIPLQLERHDYYVHRGGREYVSMKQRQDRANSAPKVCPYCTKEYSSKSKLNRHIRVIHEQSIVIKCKICSKTFCSQSSLKVHMDRHTGNRTCRCPYCPYTDFRGYMINQHVQIEHPGKEKPFKRNLVFSEVKQEQPVDLSQQPHQQQIVLQKDMGDIVYEMTDSIGQNGEIILQVPTQQIEVDQVDMEQCVEEAVAAGNVLLEYYVVQ